MNTPKELYESLLSDTPNRHREPVPFPKDLVDFAAKLGHQMTKTEGSMFDLIHELPKMIAARYPDENSKQFFTSEDFFYVGLLDLSEVNAKAMPAPNGGMLIVLNWGLPTFLYEVARAIFTRFIEDSAGKKPFEESIPSIEETGRWIAEIFAWYKGVERPAAFDFPARPAQIWHAGIMATFAEQFVVSHEMAHFFAGHLKTPFSMREEFDDLPAEIPSSEWEQEFEADTVGLRILWGERGVPELQHEQMDAYTGADFFFQTMSLYEDLAGIPVSETHPSSRLRLEHMREYAKSTCANDDSWSNLSQHAHVLEEIFGIVRKTILEPSPEQIEKAKQRAKIARDKFEELLEACAQGIVPNYVRLDHEVEDMFSDYPSDAVCAAIASSMDTANQYIQTFDKHDPPRIDRIAYQKWKLLIHLLNSPLPDGVRTAIKAMCETNVG